ncbi:hypothetical protein E3N88_09755 [Mikania micrantha]|uniref:RRM domain-containing protein n=1 Tax=Mikania micrantha TaxID=192012 RepID=A0A5N6PJX9_9ASTR|nr:hypothetical protein E3N88_09755 [Mikania micrantha]
MVWRQARHGEGRRVRTYYKDDEGWCEVKRRCKGQSQGKVFHKEMVEKEKVISFFLQNLPEEISEKELWWECKCYGQVVDAYIARKRDAQGGRFGFVRFIKVLDAEKMTKALNNLRMGSMKISARVAMYDKGGRKIKAETRKGLASINQFGDGGCMDQRHTEVWNCHGEKRGKTYKDVVTGRVYEKSTSCVKIYKDVDAFKRWRRFSIIGEVVDVNVLSNLKGILKGMNVVNVDLRYVGGLKVLITFNSTMEAKVFTFEKKLQWSQSFRYVEVWEGQHVEYRLAWIRIQGVPIQLWDAKVFDEIGGKVGRVVQGSTGSLDDGNLAYEIVGVLVKNYNKVQTKVKVCWNNVEFETWVEESGKIWVPKFLEPEDSRGLNMAEDDLMEVRLDQRRSPENSPAKDGCPGLVVEDEPLCGKEKSGGEEAVLKHCMGNMTERNLSTSTLHGSGEYGDQSALEGEQYINHTANNINWNVGPTHCIINEENLVINDGPAAESGVGRKRKSKEKKSRIKKLLKPTAHIRKLKIPDLNLEIPDDCRHNNIRSVVRGKKKNQKKKGRKRVEVVRDTFEDEGQEDQEQVHDSDWLEGGEATEFGSVVEREQQRSEQIDGVELDRIIEVGACSFRMKILSLNIRGVRGEKKAKWVRDLKKEKEVSFVAIQETMKMELSESQVGRLWDNSAMEFCMMESNGRSGGIVSIWDPGMFKSHIMIKSQNFVLVSGFINGMEEEMFIVNVYAPNDPSRRKELWGVLLELKKLILGFISAAGLKEYRMGGYKFTYMSEDGGKLSKIDRALVCTEVINKWPDATLSSLERGWSDHRPLILSFTEEKYRETMVDRPKLGKSGFKELDVDQWKWEWVRDPMSQEEWGEVGSIMRTLSEVVVEDKEDKWFWQNEFGTSFSVKAVRREIEENTYQLQSGRLFFWNNWVLKKVNVFVWRACMNRIPTKDALLCRGMEVGSSMCLSCGMVDESVDHLLVTCVVARAIWWQICRWLKIPCPTTFESVEGLLDHVDTSGREKKMKKVMNLIFQTTLWRIWQTRNEKIFKGVNKSWFSVIDEVKELSFLWLRNRSGFSTAGWKNWSSFIL